MNASYAESLRVGNLLGNEPISCGARSTDTVGKRERGIAGDFSQRAVSITMAAIALSATVFGLIAASF